MSTTKKVAKAIKKTATVAQKRDRVTVCNAENFVALINTLSATTSLENAVKDALKFVQDESDLDYASDAKALALIDPQEWTVKKCPLFGSVFTIERSVGNYTSPITLRVDANEKSGGKKAKILSLGWFYLGKPKGPMVTFSVPKADFSTALAEVKHYWFSGAIKSALLKKTTALEGVSAVSYQDTVRNSAGLVQRFAKGSLTSPRILNAIAYIYANIANKSLLKIYDPDLDHYILGIPRNPQSRLRSTDDTVFCFFDRALQIFYYRGFNEVEHKKFMKKYPTLEAYFKGHFLKA